MKTKQRTEMDVRAWVRQIMPVGQGLLTWVEPRTGGTFGAPDLFAVVDGKFVAFELKVGEASFVGEYAHIKMDVRPAQKVWHRLHARSNAPVYFIVGVRFGAENAILLVNPHFAIQKECCVMWDEWQEYGTEKDRLESWDAYQRLVFALNHKDLWADDKGAFLLATNRA